jgi:alpha-mannosidase
MSPTPVQQQSVEIPYNVDVISSDGNRNDGTMFNGQSLPAEQLPEYVESECIRFKIGNKDDEQNNAVVCNGQTISLPAGNFTKLYLLAAAVGDNKADFIVDGQPINLVIQRWTGYVGQFYNRVLNLDEDKVLEMKASFAKTNNIAYQYSYLFKYEIPIPVGAKSITLPNNRGIKIVAMTVAAPKAEEMKPLQALYDNFKDNPAFSLRSK